MILTVSPGSPVGRPEFIIAEIVFKESAKLLLAVVYRPPNIGHLEEVFRLVADLQTNYMHSVIMGDFNADLLQHTFDSQQLNAFVASSSLYLVPFEPTHHLRNSSTLLDLCIIDDADKLVEFGQHDVAFLSAHDLIYIKYAVKVNRRRDRFIVCRDWHALDVLALQQDVEDLDWDGLFSATTMDEKISCFNSGLLELLDIHVPLRRRNFKNFPAPWLTEDIRQCMRERNQARRTWRRSRKSQDYDRYKVSRNRTQNKVRTAKREYYLNLFSDLDKANNVWGTLRHLGLIKTKDSNANLSVSVDRLNEFFVGNTAVVDRGLSFSALLRGEYIDTSFHWSYITPRDISKLIAKASSNAVGRDGIPLRYIKLIMFSVLPVIEHLLNFSLQNGVFPEAWKAALICPIPKIKNPTMPQHYRPISILPALSKIMERAVSEQIRGYLEDADLLDPCQSAYRRHHSAQTCLVRMLDEIRQAADRRMITVAVFFDFSKAFDRVDHLTLIGKLKKLNFSDSTLTWIYSYLTDRTQTVKDRVADTSSVSSYIRQGVPQGSVLGPLLFTLYLSDFRHVLRHSNYNFYADDLQIYLHREPHRLQEAIQCVNDDIEAVIEWSTTNNLMLNPEKTQTIIMGTSRYVNSIDVLSIPRIKVGTSTLQYSTSVNYLGVTISNNLSWERQANNITKKIRSALYRLRLCKHLFPATLRLRLVTTLILPHVDYCSVAFTDMTSEQNLKIQRALNAGIRFVVNARRDEHITPYYQNLRMLKVEARRTYFVGCLLFNLLQTGQPSHLSDKMNFRAQSSARNTRSSKDTLIVPQCRTEMYKKSFASAAVRLWNGLPQLIRCARTLADFKRQLYTHLLDINF